LTPAGTGFGVNPADLDKEEEKPVEAQA